MRSIVLGIESNKTPHGRLLEGCRTCDHDIIFPWMSFTGGRDDKHHVRVLPFGSIGDPKLAGFPTMLHYSPQQHVACAKTDSRQCLMLEAAKARTFPLLSTGVTATEAAE